VPAARAAQRSRSCPKRSGRRPPSPPEVVHKHFLPDRGLELGRDSGSGAAKAGAPAAGHDGTGAGQGCPRAAAPQPGQPVCPLSWSPSAAPTRRPTAIVPGAAGEASRPAASAEIKDIDVRRERSTQPCYHSWLYGSLLRGIFSSRASRMTKERGIRR